MNIALVRRRFDASGGAELYTQRLIEALLQNGHEVHLYAEAWDDSRTGLRWHAVDGGGTRSTRARRFAEAVERALAGNRHDCVLSLERTLGQDVYRAGDGVHRVWLEQRRRFAPWWKRWMTGLGSFHRGLMALEAETLNPRHTGLVVVNSEMVRGEIRRCFNFPDDRIRTVRNGVNVDRFQGIDREAARRRFELGDGDYALLFAGSGWERKGLRYAIKAAGALGSRGVKLLVAGRGKIPSNVPANVRFCGPLRDMEQAYAAADLLLCLPIYEPSANVVCEALATGLPVVTCEQNGAAEWLISPELGTVLNDPSDIQAVLRAVETHRARGGTRVRADLSALALERNVRETLAVLEEARERRAQLAKR